MHFDQALLGPVHRARRPAQHQFCVFRIPLAEVTRLTETQSLASGYLPDLDLPSDMDRPSESPVHRSMRRTLVRMPERFFECNDGLMVLAAGCLVDVPAQTLTLTGPHLLDGCQTQGVVADIQDAGGIIPSDAWVRLTVLEVLPEHHTVITSARGCFCRMCQRLVLMRATDLVRHQHLDELEVRLRLRWPGLSLGNHLEATDFISGDARDEEFIFDADRLLRLLYLCLPREAWAMYRPLHRPLAFTYPFNLAGTHQDNAWPFREWADFDCDPARSHDVNGFHLDAVGDVVALDQRWRCHPLLLAALAGVQAKERPVKWVPDGVLFPVLAALAESGAHRVDTPPHGRRWVVRDPVGLDVEAFARHTMDLLTRQAGGDPDVMGRSTTCYRLLARWVRLRTSAANAS